MAEQGLKLTALGKYTLIASLAEGGMAKVYLGLMAGPAGFNKLLVIKVLNRDEATEGSEDSVQLFWDEARLAARVIHPNIVHTYEVGEVEGRYFLAMEYLDGQSYRVLQARMGKAGLPPREELRIISETARGLHYAHELKDFKGEPLGVVHRDVSPQNVFITYEGQVKLLDFGIAKTYDSGHKTQVGLIKGKLDYIAPEQLSGDDIDARADIFALGVMLWEAVTQKRFAGGRKVAEVTKIHARLTGGEPKLRAVKPDVPEALARIIDRAIALDPANRWPDAGALADALDAYIVSTGHRPGAKPLSEAMNALFSEERRVMHKLIDQQIEANAARPLSGTTGILPHIGAGGSLTSSSGRDLEMTASSASVGIPVVGNAGAPGAKSSNNRLVGAVIAGAVAAAIALLLFAPGKGTEPAGSAAVPVVQENSATAAQPSDTVDTNPPARLPGQETAAKATVLISLRTFPADARVTLDGAELPVPFSGEFRRSPELHHLEATAQGHEPYRKLIKFETDQTIDIVLEQTLLRARRPGQRGGPGTNAPPPVTSAPVPAPEPSPTPVTKPVVPGGDIDFVKPRPKPSDIDTANPYAKKP